MSTEGSSPISELPVEVKAKRAQSFGAVADDYQRYRPSPPAAAVDWLLPERIGRVVDLGSGTGRLTRLLVDRADEVVAVDPDSRMRAVLAREVPTAVGLEGRGESIPLPDGSVDAVLAATSWHWMDPVATLHEIQRVLVPGGVLGVLTTGPDREGRTMRSAAAVHQQTPRDSGRAKGAARRSDGDLSRRMLTEVLRPGATLEIPAGMPFEPPEHRTFPWRAAFDADELVGLLGTFSWFLTLSDAEREALVTETRSFIAEVRGARGTEKVDIPFRAQVWRTHRMH